MTQRREDGPRMLTLNLKEQSVAAFARLKDRYHVDSDAEVIKKALALLDVAGYVMDDDSGILVMGEGNNKKTVHMRR